MSGGRLERVVLVGFMGSGKTTVGRRLAGVLGWRFLDFDEEIESEEGATVAEIFADEGEPRFREIEARVAGRLLRQSDVVLGSGGGWAAAHDRLRSLPSGTATVWLRVTPETALERVSAEPRRRPLLAVDEPLGAATELLRRRSAAYGSADWTVDTEGRTVEDVSARILEILAEAFPETARNDQD